MVGKKNKEMRGWALVYLEMFISDMKSIDTREWPQQSTAESPGPSLTTEQKLRCLLSAPSEISKAEHSQVLRKLVCEEEEQQGT